MNEVDYKEKIITLKMNNRHLIQYLEASMRMLEKTTKLSVEYDLHQPEHYEQLIKIHHKLRKRIEVIKKEAMP